MAVEPPVLGEQSARGSTNAQPVEGQRVAQRCPTCAVPLWTRALGVGRLEGFECRTCAGLWLEQEVFTHLLESPRRSSASLPEHRPGAAAEGGAHVGQAGPMYRKCPHCSTLMNRKSFAEGVVVDECLGHGVWFDADELDDIIRHSRHSTVVADPGTRMQKLHEQEVERAAQQGSTNREDVYGPDFSDPSYWIDHVTWTDY